VPLVREAGAHSERRGDAGPVRDSLGGQAAPTDFTLLSCP
jgi:hypothetical protein